MNSGPRTIVVQPAGTSLISGASTVEFGTRMTGSGSGQNEFTFRNPGNADLTGVALTGTGLAPSEAAIVTMASSGNEA